MPELIAEDSLLAEHLAGSTVRTIAKRHGLTRSTAHRTVIKQGKTLVDSLERNLRARVWPWIEIPPQMPGDRMDAIHMLDWCVKQLRERGWEIEVTTRRAPGSLVFVLTTPPGRNE